MATYRLGQKLKDNGSESVYLASRVAVEGRFVVKAFRRGKQSATSEYVCLNALGRQEDCGTVVEEISDVVHLVDGVTKIGKITFKSSEEKQAENFRKMVLSMADDFRVVIIKLADRLHNMRTLEHLSEGKRLEIAQETLEIYAPLANRIGVGWVKNELEDLCLKHLKPDVYEMLRVRVAKRDEDRQQYSQEVRELVERKRVRVLIAWLERELDHINTELAEAIRHSPVWRDKDELLQSVPGVGPVLTSTVLASLPELGTLTNKQIAALLGVAPLNRAAAHSEGDAPCGADAHRSAPSSI